MNIRLLGLTVTHHPPVQQVLQELMVVAVKSALMDILQLVVMI